MNAGALGRRICALPREAGNGPVKAPDQKRPQNPDYCMQKEEKYMQFPLTCRVLVAQHHAWIAFIASSLHCPLPPGNGISFRRLGRLREGDSALVEAVLREVSRSGKAEGSDQIRPDFWFSIWRSTSLDKSTRGAGGWGDAARGRGPADRCAATSHPGLDQFADRSHRFQT